MTRYNPAPSDQPPASLVPTDQGNKKRTLLAHSVSNVHTSAQALRHTMPLSNALMGRSWDLATKTLAQAQRDFALMEKHLALEKQALQNVAVVMSQISLPPTNLLRDIGHVAAVDRASQQMASTLRAAALATSLYERQQWQSWLHPTHTLLDDLHATTARYASAAALALGESVRSHITADMESLVQSFRSALPDWGIVPSSTQIFPALHLANQLPSLLSALPDLSWLPGMTDHINALLAALPHWPPLDFKRLKERIKQRLIAAFSSLGLCFAPSMSEELMYQIVDLLDSGGRPSSIMLLIWNYYARSDHARLQQAVERWRDNPEYARRWHSVVFPAFQAHTRREYGLSINALAPLVEGIASHVVAKNRLLPAWNPRRGQLGLGATKSVILRALRTAGDEANLESDTTDLARWVRVKSALAYVEDMFCEDLDFERDYDHLHREDRQLRRHGLAHGIQTSAMTALNSLRLFLLLDTMHDLLHSYITRGGIMKMSDGLPSR